jgi:hypothetical protein
VVAACLGLLVGLLAPGRLAATTITWAGAAGQTNWFTATNWAPAQVPGATDDVFIAGGASTIVALTNAAAVQALTLSNRTLIFHCWSNYLTASSIVVDAGAIVTHGTNTATTTNPGTGQWDPNAGVFIQCTNLTINSGGRINADRVGFMGGDGASNGYGPGRGWVNAGAGYGSGGGHGGFGGDVAYASRAGGMTNDNPHDPGLPGSGGAYGGGAGGGYVKIVASGAVSLSGTNVITANGGSANNGGGAGGGINILCAALSGSGPIQANGGQSVQTGGGGGGLVKIVTTGTSTFSGSISANAGGISVANTGGGGQIILQAPAGSSLGLMSARQGGAFAQETFSGSNIPGLVSLSDWSLLPATLSGGGGARFACASGSVSSLTITNYNMYLDWYVGGQTNWLRAGNITIQSAGSIGHVWNTATTTNASGEWEPNSGVFIACSNLTVASGGMINVNFAGFIGGIGGQSGYGPGRGWVNVGDGYGSGGGHGGFGGHIQPGGAGSYRAGGMTNDNPHDPGLPGSGGAYSGGAGGGYVKIVASGTVSLSGTNAITANGGAAGNGGGSGGGINILCAVLSGSGSIQANGGRSTAYFGGGGGGLVKIVVTNASTFSGPVSADAGGPAPADTDRGGGGRITIQAPAGSSATGVMSARQGGGYSALVYSDTNIPGLVSLSDWSLLPATLSGGGARFACASGSISSLTITNYNMYLDWYVGGQTNWLRAGNITIQSAGSIGHVWNTTTTTNASGEWVPNSGVFVACSNLTVESGGSIDVVSVGFRGGIGTFSPGRGPGGGGYNGGGTGGGGGYGGQGGAYSGGLYAAGGQTYGSLTNPLAPGSGGGNIGQPGGGYVKIVAEGTVSLSGTNSINASGGDATSFGGGSGGGIFIRCYSLTGSGTIRANGGNGAVSGGGGGGGRIAIYVSKAPFYTCPVLFTPTVNGGTCGASAVPGTAGTIYRDLNKPRGTLFSAW